MENTKKPWQSKTVVINAISGLAAIVALFVPGAEAFAGKYAGEIVLALNAINLVLRITTKNKISIE